MAKRPVRVTRNIAQPQQKCFHAYPEVVVSGLDDLDHVPELLAPGLALPVYLRVMHRYRSHRRHRPDHARRAYVQSLWMPGIEPARRLFAGLEGLLFSYCSRQSCAIRGRLMWFQLEQGQRSVIS